MSEAKTIISPDTKRKNRVPPGQHLVQSWPVLHEGPVQEIDENEWRLKIFGLVENEIELTMPQLIELPRVKVFSDIHCVTTWSKLGVNWEGVSTSAIKGIAKLKPEAAYVTVHSYGDYTTNLELADFFGEDVLFASIRDGQKIDAVYGHPIRLVVPRLYYWKSAKWVCGLEFTSEEKLGFWEVRGYHRRGDPWREERYSERRHK